MIVRILNEGIATGLAAQRASLMKEVVDAHEFAKLGKDLDESISGKREEIHYACSGLSARRDSTHSSTVG